MFGEVSRNVNNLTTDMQMTDIHHLLCIEDINYDDILNAQ